MSVHLEMGGTPASPLPSGGVLRGPARRVRGGAAAFVRHAWPYAVVLVAWDAWVRTRDVQRIVAPAPWEALRTAVTEPGYYVPSLLRTCLVATLGLALGTVLGAGLALLAWRARLLAAMLTPGALMMRSTPIVVVIPVLARVLGYSWGTTLAITTVISWFPAFVLVTTGLNDVPASSTDVMAALGARTRDRLRFVALPSAVPNLLLSLRLSGSKAILAAMFAEYLMGQEGLGRLLALSQSRTDVNHTWAVAIVVTVVSALVYTATARLERWGMRRWRP